MWRPACRRLSTAAARTPVSSFSFSGAGWLSPWHMGVTKALVDKGVLTSSSKLAGTSGGALVAASTAVGVSPAQQMEAFKRMASICRKQGFVGKVRKVLEEHLEEAFPPDAHHICNGRLTVTAMQVWPRFQLAPVLLDHFSSRADLLSALLTSSHVPLYLDVTAPWTAFRDGLYVDGGLVDIVPPVHGYHKVCVFPGNVLFRQDIDISPGDLQHFPYSIGQLMQWAFIAPEDTAADRLLMFGYEAACLWMERQGLPLVETDADAEERGEDRAKGKKKMRKKGEEDRRPEQPPLNTPSMPLPPQ